MTETSTGTSSTTIYATPICTALYTKSDKNCGEVAAAHDIQLYSQEADYSSESTNCENLLRGYGICNAVQTTSESAVTTTPGLPVSAAFNVTRLNNTIPINATTPRTTRSSNPVEKSGMTMTTWRTSTYTYALGTGSNARLTTVVVTHTDTGVFTSTPTSNSPSTAPASASPASLTSSTGVTSTTTTAPESQSPSPSAASSVRETSFSTTPAAVTSSVPVSSTCPATVAAPAPTQAGVVPGCAKWYVARPGDYCNQVADEFRLDHIAFMNWNQGVNPPACPSMLAGYAYCVAACGAVAASLSAASASASVSATPTTSSLLAQSTAVATTATATFVTLPTSASSSTAVASVPSSAGYVAYSGNGSPSQGWPSMSQWVDFDAMFEANTPSMKRSCLNWGVQDDTDEEIADMKSAIQSVGAANGIDARFVLAIVMQESTGCVRVITTAYSVSNPGLMQSHNGTGSCNTNNAPSNVNLPGADSIQPGVQSPCPASEITQMIQDGVAGTSSGAGLKQLFAQERPQSDGDAMAYYRTARAYNGGSVAANGNLAAGCCTAAYVEDIANRLTGWPGR
ncbi:Hypothetical predicted protein [Lecanosticta acicola]|uniref:LysM domain-containing protein n=1 Tax=Lecanosticta acicola TaxID=111012 RepID=A0AAI8Z1B1_9PEZI|nr:Hypothetical predicted protein [Lecanosticta acicola]